jgi:hypothetical protein
VILAQQYQRYRNYGLQATERAIVRLLQGQDIFVPLLGVDRAVEVKCRSARFRQLSDWLGDILIVKADRQEALVVLRMSLGGDRRAGGAAK